MDACEYDFNRICRACKCESTDMCSVFEKIKATGRNARLDEMLMACASVQINTDDGLPGSICQKCVSLLSSAYDFKQQCESADISLREYLKDKEQKRESDFKQVESNKLVLRDFRTICKEIQAAATTVKSEADVSSVDYEEQLKDNKDYVEIVDKEKIMVRCNICTKMFYTLEGLKGHMRIHTGKMYKCNVCNKEYTRLNHLQRHMASHGRRKAFICKICNKSLTRVDHLKRHLITHMRTKPFQCEMCKRGFSRAEHLMNHLKRCKGEKVHSCEVCSKGFTRSDSLEAHMRLHDKAPVPTTIETLDNIEKYYIEVESLSSKFEFDQSDNSDPECFEPEVDIVEVKLEPYVELPQQPEDTLLDRDIQNSFKPKLRKRNRAEKHHQEPPREKKQLVKKIKEELPDDYPSEQQAEATMQDMAETHALESEETTYEYKFHDT